MNRTLYAYEMRKSSRTLLIFAAILAMYVICIVWMFDPGMMKSLEQFYRAMPQLMSAVGMKLVSTTLLGFLISYLYGFILVVFPMVFTILRCRALLAEKVEKKNMAALLAAPVSRRTIVRTQIGALLTGILLLTAFATLLEIVFCQLWFPGQLDVGALFALNGGLLALQFFIGGLCMLSSAAFNDAAAATGVSSGVCAVMLLAQMIRNTEISRSLDKLKYCTFFTLFDPNGIAEGAASALAGAAVLAAAGVALYIASAAVFVRRDLPI